MIRGNQGAHPRVGAFRGALSAAALLWALLVGLVVVPGGLRAQTETPCMFDNGSDEWACVEMSRVYESECEGPDCYSGMEFCCMAVGPE